MTLHIKHRIRLFLIIIATLFYFLANIQRVAIPGAVFNLMQNDLMVSASKITFFGAIFCYTYAFTQLIVGLMVDKIGGFRVIALGSIAFCVGSILFSTSNSLILMYLSRGLIGFGAATFYLSAIREVKKYVKDRNFSVAISYILFFGYSGGIVANAPLVALINNFGWKNIFFEIGIFSLILCLIYLLTLYIFEPVHCVKKSKISIENFKEILSNKNNINLYIFGCTNYALYYVLQSVIGKKFLEDFCNFDINNAALILSIMALVSALAGTISAFISKLMNNKRAIIFKIYAIFSLISFFLITLFTILGINSKIIALILFIPSFIGSISPILILSLHLINRYEVSATAVAIQNFNFFMMVGILGSLSGLLMNLFKPINSTNGLVYPKEAYALVFGLFFIISIIEVICAFRTKDKYY